MYAYSLNILYLINLQPAPSSLQSFTQAIACFHVLLAPPSQRGCRGPPEGLRRACTGPAQLKRSASAGPVEGLRRPCGGPAEQPGHI